MHKILIGIKKLVTISLICMTMASCGVRSFIKIREAMEQESVVVDSFKQEIPFRYEQGFIFIDVLIGDKVRQFIFDTGAVTLLDDDVAESVEYEKVGAQKFRGASDKTEKLKMVKLESLSIGGVSFSSIVAGVMDLDALKEKFCLNFSGIIGANVMNKAVWQIDYKRKVITLTDTRDSLLPLTGAQKLDFRATERGTPILSLNVNGQHIGEATFDTGSGGGIDIPETSNIAVDTTKAFIMRRGLRSGVFGDTFESSKMILASNLKIGPEFEIENVPVTFNSVLSAALIGNRFLDNYVVTIDWPSQEMFLFPVKSQEENGYRTFGFGSVFEDGKVIINFLYENSSADRAGFMLNDQIVQVNSVDLRMGDQERYCKLLHTGALKNANKIVVTIKRENKEITHTLVKQDLVGEILRIGN